MSITRRNLLIAGAATLGYGAASCAHQLLSANGSANSATHPSAPSEVAEVDGAIAPSAPSTSAPTNPAPEGMVAPMKGDVRIVVFSDINGPYRSTDYIRQVMEAIPLIPAWEPDLVLCAGDMVAGQLRSLTQSEIQAMWNGFERLVFQPIRQAGIPFALTIGNHDASNYIQNGNYVFALERDMANTYWNAPRRELGIEFVDRAGFPFYYAFLHRDIFYLMWDASSATVAADQIAWADQTLASATAQNAKMRIVMGHLPLYAISQGRDRMGEILNQPDVLRSLLERHNVHTYISGHHHAYYPGHVGQLNLLHCGALGSGPRTWLNTIAASIHTLTVMDIDLTTASTRYTTYDMTTRQLVDVNQLPRLIVGPTGRVLRYDVAWDDLTPEERDRPYVPSSN